MKGSLEGLSHGTLNPCQLPVPFPVPLTEDPEGPGPLWTSAQASLICSRSGAAILFVLKVAGTCVWFPFTVFSVSIRWYRIDAMFPLHV